MIFSLVFELDSIQSYLFSSGRLRDVAGASELLDRLTSDQADDNLLDRVCRAAGVEGRIDFPRRAGGAFYAFSEDGDAIGAFFGLWTLAVQQWAPGIGFSFGRGEGETHDKAFERAREAMRADASRQRPWLPLAAPVAARARRTGLAAEAWDKGKGEPIDAASRRRKRFADSSRAGFVERYSPEDLGLTWRDWPLDLESEFPFRGDDRTIALIHADGNGLGQLLLGIQQAIEQAPNKFLELYQRFSRLVSDVTVHAAREATRRVIVPARGAEEKLAARPILLGGDDIVVLVRADLAMRYCEVFAAAFEAKSREALQALRDDGLRNLPARLTLGFGVVYMRASQPFFLAAGLAEQLMAEAKNAAKRRKPDDPDASVAFYRITGALTDDYDRLVAQTMTHRHGQRRYLGTLGTYFFGEAEKPSLMWLRRLSALLVSDEMARGPTRQLMTLMGQGVDVAERRYQRWRSVMKERHEVALRRFDEALAALAGIGDGDLPYRRAEDSTDVWRSPLGDALALMGAGDGPDDGHNPVTEPKEAAA